MQFSYYIYSVVTQFNFLASDLQHEKVFNSEQIKTPSIVQLRSVTQSCLTLCDPTNCRTSGFPVFHHLPEFALVSIKAVMPSNHLILCCPLLLLSVFPSIRVFSSKSVFASGSQSVGVSALASVLPMNIQD